MTGAILALTAIGQPASVVKVALPDGCSTELTTKPAHPFLAEFTRSITVTCSETAATTIILQKDPGGLGRIELVRMAGGDLAVTDSWQSTVIHLSKPLPPDAGTHEGKLDRYEAPCARTQQFQRRRGKFLGAFDYCDHRWVFLQAP